MKHNKTVIVGINDSHDASACVVIGDTLVCSIAEERIQRIKNMGGFPKNAIEHCLKIAGISISDVDYVAVGNIDVSCTNLHNMLSSLTIPEFFALQEKYWEPVIYEHRDMKLRRILPDYQPKGTLYYPMEHIPFAFNRELNKEVISNIRNIRKSFIADYFRIPESSVFFIDHHTAHAYYAYYANPLRGKRKNFLVLTADAGGDGAYESVNIFKSGVFESLYKAHECIVAPVYTSITLMLGMKPHQHEYKVMGLAPYAKEHDKKKPREIFMDCLDVKGITFKRNPEVKDLFKYFRDRLKYYRFDAIAGGLQDFAEEKISMWVSNAVKHTGIKDIVLSGGLGLNIKINKRITEIKDVRSFFVPPGPGDESLSIGACYALEDMLREKRNPLRIQPMYHAYLGNCAKEDEIAALLRHPLIRKNYTVMRNASVKDIAEMLCKGEICAIFMDDMEFGPRALGHRSIIADPSKHEIVKKINEAIKMRDFWMPFTASILTERINDYLYNPKDIINSYMTVSFDSTPLGQKHLAAAIHPYDKTVRPQKVEKEHSPKYYSIIRAFEKKTRIGAVLNTSLNIHGKPIVMRPAEIALEILSNDNVRLDNIYIEGHLLRKKKHIQRAS
jgi:carbamoyltransferase